MRTKSVHARVPYTLLSVYVLVTVLATTHTVKKNETIKINEAINIVFNVSCSCSILEGK